MARQYGHLLQRDGVFVPRWLVGVVGFLFLLWFASRIFISPAWIVQQLDAPDGSRSARLMRSVYVQQHFTIRIKDGWLWQTAYYSEPITSDFRVDLNERLRWSEDSSQLYFYIDQQPAWGYDFNQQRNLHPQRIPDF